MSNDYLAVTGAVEWEDPAAVVRLRPSRPAPAPNDRTRTATRVLADRLEARLDEVCSGMLAQMRREYPEYGDVPDHARQALLVRGIAEVFIALLRDARSVSSPEQSQLRDIAIESARHGLSLETLLGGVKLGLRMAWLYGLDEVRSMSPANHPLDALEELGLQVLNYATDVGEAFARGYEEHDLNAGGGARGPAALLTRLFHGATVTDSDLARTARGAGLDPFGTYGLVVVVDPRGEIGVAGLAELGRSAARRLGGAVQVEMFDASPPHVALVAPVASPNAWARAMADGSEHMRQRPGLWLACKPRPGLRRLAAAYRRKAALLPILVNSFPRRRFMHAEELTIYTILGGTTEERRDFVEETLGGLLALPESRREPLVETVEALHSQASKDAAARALHVHPRTVGYRLSRIEEVTGLDLRRPIDRVRLDLAVRLYRLLPGTQGRREIW